MHKRVAFVAAFLIAALMTACASSGKLSPNRKGLVSPEERLQLIRRAQVWEPTDVPSKDLKAGPPGHGAFKPNETVTCKYADKKMAGRSPKFECVIPPDDELKVKYGVANGEVYAEVAATRLFWALGFPADRMYPVRVICEGCPKLTDAAPAPGKNAFLFDPVSVERKFKGRAIETEKLLGWAWPELELVDESAGGAPRAHRDALRLLAVFIQHTDSKPEQQRLICVDEKEKEDDAHHGCEHPVMMVNDLGQTFGQANLFNRDALGSVNIELWSKARIWSEPNRCIGELAPSQSGTIDYPLITEAGRKFLSDLLMQLSDAQIHDLFEVSRFAERKDPGVRTATVNDWVEAFKKKRAEIASRTCPV